MTDHIHDNLDAYLAGDLTTIEREQVESHLAACESCKQAVADALRLERTMNRLFAEARPTANLDDRIIGQLAKEPLRLRSRPTLWRFVGAAAAVLVVGLIGAAVQAIGDADSMVAKAVKEIGGDPAYQSQSAVSVERTYFGATRIRQHGYVEGVEGRGGETSNGINAEADKKYGNVIKGLIAKEADLGFSVQDINPDPHTDEGIQYLSPALSPPRLNLPNPAGFGPTGQGGAFDVAKKLKPAFDARDSFYRDLPKQIAMEKPYYDDRKAEEKAERLRKAMEDLEKVAKEPGQPDPSKVPSLKLDGGGIGGPVPMPPTGLPIIPAVQPPAYYGPATVSQTTGTPPLPTPVQPTTGQLPYFFGKESDGAVPKPGQGKTEVEDGKKVNDQIQGRDPKEGKGKGGEGKKDEQPPADDKKPAPKAEPKKQAPPPDEPPLETNRKIIRTGDMEFEIDSFDKSVENITRLVTGIKGGFVATVNSDKLPNGKMKGSIVVRMPPQYLDKFVLDLRRELAKTGELKNQRIISLDVTKQYTDIESRLRAARTMEERLIQIIKTGKGEIKDLVAAERELGTWRTKIEEMEGEIRYYSNQVSLSTLTIQLYEKEILAPTAIVVSENVRMRLEVDDVARAHKAAMDLVEKVDGRITRSELKQHMAGQLQSILCADIPPKMRDTFRDGLKKLGIVSLHEENQSQHTEGGVGKSGALKPRQDDVHFDITMHNTANIAPSRSTDMKVATTDVPAAYAKLLEEIAKADGQVRDGKLNEQEKLNINAFLDFNIPPAKKPQIDKVLDEIGPVLERTNMRAPISQISTERKFGYLVTLRDFASIPPSKAVVETIAAVDVPAAFAKVQEEVIKVKGQIAAGTLNEQDKANINAQIDFTVFIESKPAIDALVEKLGGQLSRTNLQAPLNQLSTPKKFGFTLILRDYAFVPASKASELKIAVTDVPTAFASLIEAIKAAEGKADAKLNEKDKQDITAHLAFSVPIKEKPKMDELLGKLGTMLARNDVEAPMNQLTTDKKFGYVVDLRDFAAIPPSQSSALTVALSNVLGNYAKLTKKIEELKGQIRNAKLDEKDKLNVSARVEFTVPDAEKQKIEDLLEGIGTILSRINEQAPANVLSTDRKFGYVVDLRDFANIPARETFVVQTGMIDVPTAFTELKDAVARTKGWISVSKLVEDNKAKIYAQLDFDVPTADKDRIEALLKKTGVILSRNSNQIGVSELATDKKVGYRVTLKSTSSLLPREIVALKFDVADVDAKAAEVKGIVLTAKGRVIDSGIEHYENGKAIAVLKLEVPAASQDEVIRQMKATAKLASQTLSRNPEVPENELTTSLLVVTLNGSTPIVPSDEGLGASVHKSLYLSFRILTGIVMALIVGLSAIVPLAALCWIGFKAYGLLAGSSVEPVSTMSPAAAGSKSVTEEEKPGDGDASVKA